MNLASTAGLALSALIATAPAAHAADMIEADAQQVLTAMSEYMGGLESFTAVMETAFEVVDTDGQKVQMIGTGIIAVERPGKVHYRRIGSVMDAEVVLSDGTLSILGRNINGYLQIADQGDLEQAIATLDELGFPAPGAAFMTANPAEHLLTEDTVGVHLGMAKVAGDSAHHLAFRNDVVDWQLWVADDDDAVPLRYVVTNKWVAGAPQFTAQFRRWNVNPEFGEGVFAFTPPEDAVELEVITVNVLGELVTVEE